MRLNKTTIRKAAPGILTAIACIGVIASDILSARAALRVQKELHENPPKTKKEAVKVVAKESIAPVAASTVSIASFIFARQIDKKVVLGLSAAVAALSDTNRERQQNDYGKTWEPDFGVDVEMDPDGEVFYISDADIWVRATPLRMEQAKNKLNKNYQLRGGLASLYEYLRMIGIPKKRIRELGLDWTEFTGWSGAWEFVQGYSWVDVWEMERDGFIDVYMPFPPMPICSDPPKYVRDISGYEAEDLKDYGIYETGEEISDYIKTTMQDNVNE